MPNTPKSLRASALVTSLIAISVVSIFTYSLLTWTSQERKQAKVTETRVMVNYNAGALLEYGLAQIGERLKLMSSFDRSEFRLRPLAVPSASFFNNSQTAGLQSEFVVGPIFNPIQRYIDPLLQVNQNDPDKGKTIAQRDILVLSKVEQSGLGTTSLKDCNCAIFQIREMPVLSYGVFTHGDLIILRPAQPMIVSGPAHANGNLIMVSEGGVYFNGTVSSAGSMQALAPFGNVYFRSGGTEGSPTYDVFNSYTGSNWKDYALSRWNGYLQTQEMGIGLIQPFGVNVTTTDATSNPYHKIIEPPVPVSQNPPANIEVEKFANKAGLVIKITLTKTTNPNNSVVMNIPDPYFTKLEGSYYHNFMLNNMSNEEAPPLAAKSVYLSTPPSQLFPPPQRDIMHTFAARLHQEKIYKQQNVVSVTAYRCIADTSGAYYRKNSDGSLGRYRRETFTLSNLFNAAYPADPNAIMRSQCGSALTRESILSLLAFVKTYYQDVNPWAENWYAGSDLTEGRQFCMRDYVARAVDYGGVMSFVNEAYYPWQPYRPCAPFLAMRPDPNVATNPPIKLWDARCRKWIDIVELDIGKLKAALDAGSIPNWNGIVYVEFDNLDTTGLRLVNGQNIPSRGTEGFTIVTNNRLYVKGHYNADGSMGTGSGTLSEANEVPAALVADAITILSNYWDDRLSRADVTRFSTIPNQNDRNVPQDTEIAAAIITGTDVYNSGGINNLVRFLEMWEDKVVRIRGALIALFKSEVAWEPLLVQNVFYPPDRQFSYSDLFKAQRFPPGTPTVRAFYKKKKQNISFEQYQALKTAINNAFANTDTTATTFNTTISNIQNQYR